MSRSFKWHRPRRAIFGPLFHQSSNGKNPALPEQLLPREFDLKLSRTPTLHLLYVEIYYTILRSNLKYHWSKSSKSCCLFFCLLHWIIEQRYTDCNDPWTALLIRPEPLWSISCFDSIPWERFVLRRLDLVWQILWILWLSWTFSWNKSQLCRADGSIEVFSRKEVKRSHLWYCFF